MATIGTLAVAITATTSGLTSGVQTSQRAIGTLQSTTGRMAQALSIGFHRAQASTVQFARNALGALPGFAARAVTGTIGQLGRLAGAAGRVRVGNPFQMGGLLKPIGMGAILGAVGVVAAAGLGAAKWGVEMALESEQASIAFEVMLGSASKARAMLTQIEGFASTSPYQLGETREAAQLLLNYGVAGKNIIPALSMIGDIASGDAEKMRGLAVAFGQSSATGRLMGQDLNQMINAGFNPLQEISQKTGESMMQLKKRMEAGRLPFSEVANAFKIATSEGGRFYQMSARQSQTIGGLWSTLKDNVGLALSGLATSLMKGLDIKGVMQGMTDGTANMRAGVDALLPTFIQFGGTVRSVFTGVWQMVTAVGNVINSWFGGGISITMAGVMEALLLTEYGFANWQKVLELATTSAMLGIATFAGQVSHLFTGVIPSVVAWGADNFFSIWQDMLNATLTMFANFGTTIKTNMGAIWEFIKSGGTKDLNMAWTPLLDGFQATVKELPNIAPRQLSAVEKALTQSRDALANDLGEGFAAFKAKRDKELAAVMAPPKDTPDGLGQQALQMPDFGDPNGGGDIKPKSFAVANAMAGSKEAFTILMDSMVGKEKQDKLDKQIRLQEKQLVSLNKINDGLSAIGSDNTETWSIT